MKLRMIVDTVMLVLFLAILDYRQIGSSHHEIFGMIFFVIVIFHNYLNRQWYKSLPRGRWNWDRRFTFLIDVVLIGSFLAVMITAPLISYKLSLDINAPLIVHRIHRIGGYDARCNRAAPGDSLERSSSAFQEGSALGK